MKTCNRDGCDNPIPKNKRNNTYCSQECRMTVSDNLYERIFCANPSCEIQFKARKAEKRKYCSKSCGAQVNSYLNTRSKPQGKCAICFEPIPSHKKYCSRHTYTSRTGVVLDTFDDGLVRCNNNNCQTLFAPSVKFRLYCSIECRSWNASTKNTPRKKFVCGYKKCENLRSSSAKTCSNCCVQYKKDRKIEKWLSGTWRGGYDSGISDIVREYLIKEANYTCTDSSCNFSTPHPEDGASVLEVDHINGDASDHSPSNVRVLCPNHHALTPTHRARNRGNGRRAYYKKITPKELNTLEELDDEGHVVVG